MWGVGFQIGYDWDMSVRDDLKKLEEAGEYLFHGSPDEIDVLEPRQPYIFDKNVDRMVPDGEMAVVASPYFEIALFRAVVNNKNTPDGHSSGFGYDEKTKKIELRMSENTFKQLQNKVGYVYVLDKKYFSPRDPNRPKMMEWRATGRVKPIQIVKVAFQDLSKDIVVE